MQNLKTLKITFFLCLVFCIMELIEAVTLPLVGKELKFALDYHNKLRRGEKAANMMKLVWNKQLANEALSWAKRCQFKHRMKKKRGENLAFNSNPGSLYKRIKDAMDAWFGEKKLHNWSANRCSRSCHYTQIVWAKTREVGCAMEKCRYLNSFGHMVKNAFYYVCFYSPRANWEKEVYKRGSPCSKCPTGTKCEKGLCTGGKAGGSSGGSSGGRSGVCKDTYNTRKCKSWAAHKYCTKNPGWMKVYCKKSCKTC